jgi:hypothetical protein
LAEEYIDRVVFAGVSNNDTVEDGMGYVERFEVPYEMGHSPETWDAFGVPYQPVTIVIDGRGGVSERIIGQVTYESLKAAIDEVL